MMSGNTQFDRDDISLMSSQFGRQQQNEPVIARKKHSVKKMISELSLDERATIVEA